MLSIQHCAKKSDQCTQYLIFKLCFQHVFVFMIEHVMPLCVTIPWVYSAAMFCVFQVCVHDRTCHATVPDNLMGVQRCYAGTEHCLREGTSSQRGKALTSNDVPSLPDSLDSLLVGVLLVTPVPCSYYLLDLPDHSLGVNGMSLNDRLWQSDLPVHSLGVNGMSLNVRLFSTTFLDLPVHS